MYSPRLYKYQDSYVLYLPRVHAFGSKFLTHILLVQTHTHDVSTPWIFHNYITACKLSVMHLNLCLQFLIEKYLP